MSNKRLIGVYDQFRARFEDAPKKLAFTKGTAFAAWKERFKSKVKELIGPFPAPVPLNAEVQEELSLDEFEEAGIPAFIQQKIVYDTEKYAACVAHLLVPKNINKGEKRPAVLVAHGHGSGKAQMVGICPTTWNPRNGSPTGGPNFEALAIHLVGQGFVVLAPDWRPFGERSLKPEYCRPGRDSCNVTDMSFQYFGFTLLALNVWDAMKSIDLLQSLPYVDGKRIGMVGKSYGGTMTTYTTALDDRIKVACVSGYLSTLDDAMSMRGLGNYCGAQFVPGLLEWGDIPDVVGLIAPRPLLIEAGKKDDCFIFPDATKAYEKLVTIYEAAGHRENLDRDVADVEHEMIFQKMPEFFKKYL
nr:alpha/beta hydrolase family protein [Candidatus Sigynarchaeota archaeon]